MTWKQEDVGKYCIKGTGASAQIYKIISVWSVPTVLFENVRTGGTEMCTMDGDPIKDFVKLKEQKTGV